MSAPEYAATHTIYRLDDSGEAVAVSSWQQGATEYNIVGSEAWETAELRLVKAFREACDWEPGTYRLEVVSWSGKEITSIERPMPLPQEYLKLPYFGGDGRLSKAFAHTMMARYGTGYQLTSRYLGDFHAHFKAEISSGELAERTGHQPRVGTPWVVTGYRSNPGGLRPSHRATPFDDEASAVAAAREAMVEGWQDVRIRHEGRMRDVVGPR